MFLDAQVTDGKSVPVSEETCRGKITLVLNKEQRSIRGDCLWNGIWKVAAVPVLRWWWW